MKALFLVPQRYSLYRIFAEIFRQFDAEIYPIDLSHFSKKWEDFVHAQTFRVPDKWRLRWEDYYFQRINDCYKEEFRRIRPDVVFVYNHELLLPETVESFKAQGAKVVFFLGDSPFYTHTNRYFLSLMFLGDAVLVPDSFWLHQLQKIGVKNLEFFQTDLPSDEYFQKELSPELYQELKTEVLYVGMCYPTSWGYKKAKFLSHFTGFDLQIHGNRHWKRWFSFFPELEAHFRERSGYVPVERMNEMYNAAKIIPVDGNPGILNGPHQRIWEALSSGSLPVMEWQNDFDEIFGPDADIPAARTYDELAEISTYYLNHENERQEKVAWMRRMITDKYSPQSNAHQIADTLGWKISLVSKA